jgi:hypothetical protein
LLLKSISMTSFVKFNLTNKIIKIYLNWMNTGLQADCTFEGLAFVIQGLAFSEARWTVFGRHNRSLHCEINFYDYFFTLCFCLILNSLRPQLLLKLMRLYFYKSLLQQCENFWHFWFFTITSFLWKIKWKWLSWTSNVTFEL